MTSPVVSQTKAIKSSDTIRGNHVGASLEPQLYARQHPKFTSSATFAIDGIMSYGDISSPVSTCGLSSSSAA